MVHIAPIVTRHKGVEYMEMGAGGGQGDLDRIHELDMTDITAIGNLMALCKKRLGNQPNTIEKVSDWLTQIMKSGGEHARLDTELFHQALAGVGDSDLDDITIDGLIEMLAKQSEGRKRAAEPVRKRIVSLIDCSDYADADTE